jgi:hypothetical protein
MLLLNLILLIDMTFSTPTGCYVNRPAFELTDLFAVVSNCSMSNSKLLAAVVLVGLFAGSVGSVLAASLIGRANGIQHSTDVIRAKLRLRTWQPFFHPCLAETISIVGKQSYSPTYLSGLLNEPVIFASSGL